MFAYCRNNPVRRIDITGTADADCYDNDPIDEEDLVRDSQGGGFYQSGENGGTANGSNNSFGQAQAPKQGISGSTYTQYSSDGKNSVVSQTTYNEYGVPGQRIDYQGRDHGVGLPHVHVYSWAMRGENLYQTCHKIYLYRM